MYLVYLVYLVYLLFLLYLVYLMYLVSLVSWCYTGWFYIYWTSLNLAMFKSLHKIPYSNLFSRILPLGLEPSQI